MYENGNILIGLFFGMMVFSSIISLIFIISNAKVFKKAGKPWWACLVPIYNFIVMIQIAKLPMIYVLFYFLPIVQIYAMFKVNIEIAKKFGKSTGFGVGMTLLGVIFIPLLAFSDNKYEDESNENLNTNNNQQFDGMNVINNSVTDDNNLNEQNFNTLTESIPQNNSNTSVEAENNILTNTQINEIPIAPLNIEQAEVTSSVGLENKVQSEASTFNVNPEPQTVEPAQTDSVQPEVNAFNVNPEPQTVEPAQTDNVQPEVNAFNVNPEPQTVEPAQTDNVQPEVNAFNVNPEPQTVEPAQTDNVQPEVNAFNVNPEPQTVEPVQTDSVQPEINAFNVNPEPQIVEPVQTNNDQLSNENIIVEPVVIKQTETIVHDKKCKNCGNDLPEIVSICPNCGADNE